MPRLCLILLALCFALHTTTSSADDKSPTPAPDLYNRAVKNLNDGMWFNDDIADLTEAVRQEPKNSDYHLALGCAEVDRAGSLAYAAFMTDQKLNDQPYGLQYALWRHEQTDPRFPEYGKPAPKIPLSFARFRTKDDLTHLKLTGAEAKAKIIALGLAAQGEWREAVRLATNPNDKAHAESVQGWGLQYELNLITYTGYSDKHIPDAPKPDDVIAAFTSATKDNPTNAAYWEGLGDSYPYDDTDDPSHGPDILLAWHKAIALKPGNTGLLFRLYVVQSRRHAQDAIEPLKAVVECDPGNSYLQYLLAAVLLKQVNYNWAGGDTVTPVPDGQTWTKEQFAQWNSKNIQKIADKDNASSEEIAASALAAVEQGNMGMRYEYPVYEPPVPKLISYAWHYWDKVEYITNGPFVGSAKLREMARALSGYAQVSAQLGNSEMALRAANDCINMGTRMAGDWPLYQSSIMDHRHADALLGSAIIAIGYNSLEHVYQILGDETMAKQATADLEEAKAREHEYLDAWTQMDKSSPPHIYDDY